MQMLNCPLPSHLFACPRHTPTTFFLILFMQMLNCPLPTQYSWKNMVKRPKKPLKLSYRLFDSMGMLVTIHCKKEWKIKYTPGFIVKKINF
jgi:hypothetical protein